MPYLSKKKKKKIFAAGAIGWILQVELVLYAAEIKNWDVSEFNELGITN